MGKTKEELKALRGDLEELDQKLSELTEEELAEVTGGACGKGMVIVGTVLALAELKVGTGRNQAFAEADRGDMPEHLNMLNEKEL